MNAGQQAVVVAALTEPFLKWMYFSWDVRVLVYFFLIVESAIVESRDGYHQKASTCCHVYPIPLALHATSLPPLQNRFLLGASRVFQVAIHINCASKSICSIYRACPKIWGYLMCQVAPGQTMMRGYSIRIGTRLPNHFHYCVSTNASIHT